MELESPKLPASYKTYAFLLLFISTLTLYLLYMQTYAQLNQSATIASIEYSEHPVSKYLRPTTAYLNHENATTAPSKYLVRSSKCKIPDIKPFNEEVKSLFSAKPYTACTKRPLLTYTTTKNNQGILHVNESAISSYSKTGISCCYCSIKRNPSKKNPDNLIKLSSCTPFEENVTLSADESVVLVKCHNNATKEVYKNVHATVTVQKDVQNKIDASGEENERHLSVLFIGIDSVSRLNLMRAMPKTYSFLKENRWLEMKGYNKVADNTFPNLMAILTGMNESAAYRMCDPKKLGGLDKCNLIWYDFRELGYVTGYAEDEGSINTFNFNKKGFVNPPTDYYFRPYVLATESYLTTSRVDEMTYCTGPETSGERIFRLIKDFATTFQDHPYFGFFWMNTFSHNKLHAISRMDRKVLQFLQDLSAGAILKDTIVIFFSDHGLRFGNIRYTRSGWLEERLPFFYLSFPKWFPDSFPEEFRNIKSNANKLSTPYDLHMTLQHILVMVGKNYTVKASDACPNCASMFQELPDERSCRDAAIEQHWCTCGDYTNISPKNATVEAAIYHILDAIHKTIDSYNDESKKCAKYKLKRVISSSISEGGENSYRNDTYLLIILETVPEAVFEATVNVKFNGGLLDFQMSGSISRLDYYKMHSYCVPDSNLKKYCHCHA